MLITVLLTHLFIDVTMLSISVTDPPEWAPTRLPLPSVIGANRSRLSLVQKQGKFYIFFRERRDESVHYPAGCGLTCCVGIPAASVGGRGGALEGRVGCSSGSMSWSLHGAPGAEMSTQPFCIRKSGLKCRVWDLCMRNPRST